MLERLCIGVEVLESVRVRSVISSDFTLTVIPNRWKHQPSASSRFGKGPGDRNWFADGVICKVDRVNNNLSHRLAFGLSKPPDLSGGV